MTNGLVEMRGGVPMVSSLDVAERFRKQHKDVLRAIAQVVESEPEFSERNFAPSEYEGRNGKNPMWWLTEAGFSVVAMGFTGPEAMSWKVKYADAFDRLRRAAIGSVSPRDVLIKLLDDHDKLIDMAEGFRIRAVTAEQGNTKMIEDRTTLINRTRAAEKRAHEATEKLRSVAKHSYKVLKEIEEGDDQDDLMSKAEATNVTPIKR